MLKFVLNTLIMLSLGAILYLVARTLPRVDDQNTPRAAFKSYWIMAYLEKADEWLKIYLEKFLRTVRVWTMKLDNIVGKKLSTFKKETSTPKNLTISGQEETKLPSEESSDKI